MVHTIGNIMLGIWNGFIRLLYLSILVTTEKEKRLPIKKVHNNILKNNRYISDGDEKTIVIPKKSENYVNDNNLYKVTY